MRLGIDLDGTVVDAAPAVVRWAKHVHDITLDLSVYDSLHTLKSGEKVTTSRLWDIAYQNESLVLTLDAIPGAVDALQQLMKDGFEVLYVTARPRACEWSTVRWLSDRGLLPPNTSVKFTRDNGTKAGQDIGVLVDDHVQHIREVVDTGTPAVLYTQPWNANLTLQGRLRGASYRAKTWLEVQSIVMLLRELEEFRA